MPSAPRIQASFKAEKHPSYQDFTSAFVAELFVRKLPVGPGKKYLNHGPASRVLEAGKLAVSTVIKSGTPVIIPDRHRTRLHEPQ